MAILLAVFLWNVDVDEVADALERANLKLIAAAIGVALATYWFRAVRWQLILRPAGRVRHSSAVLATAVGYAAMTLLPARMGDLVRPIVLARRERLAVSASLASILTERIFDLWTVVLYFLVFVIWPPQMAYLDETARRNFEILQISGYVVGTGLVLGTLVLLGLFRFQERFVELATRPVALVSSRWRQPVANFLNHFLDGLRVLQRPRDLLVAIGASLLLWYAIYWQVKLGFHKATQIGLTAFFGVGLNQATAVAIVYHAICFLPITVIGLLCLPLVGVRLREVDSLASEASEP
jgi:uncharacterized protein (TIRG00374 family)